MYRLDLTAEERNELLHVLKRHLAALQTEIWHTDHREFKEMLQSRQRIVEQVAEKVEQAAGE